MDATQDLVCSASVLASSSGAGALPTERKMPRVRS